MGSFLAAVAFPDETSAPYSAEDPASQVNGVNDESDPLEPGDSHVSCLAADDSLDVQKALFKCVLTALLTAATGPGKANSIVQVIVNEVGSAAINELFEDAMFKPDQISAYFRTLLAQKKIAEILTKNQIAGDKVSLVNVAPVVKDCLVAIYDGLKKVGETVEESYDLWIEGKRQAERTRAEAQRVPPKREGIDEKFSEKWCTAAQTRTAGVYGRYCAAKVDSGEYDECKPCCYKPEIAANFLQSPKGCRPNKVAFNPGWLFEYCISRCNGAKDD